MFYDERIENTKGKIARNSLIFAFIISFLISGFKIISKIKQAITDYEQTENFYLSLPVWLHASMILFPFIALLIGIILRAIKGNDERATAEISRYYSKASIVLMKLLFAVLATITSFNSLFFTSFVSSDLWNNLFRLAYSDYYETIQTAFFVITVYVVYSFRKNHIYFNYSIIDSENYYKKVFRNIGKLSIYFVAYYVLSLVTFLIIIRNSSQFTDLFIPWTVNTLAFYVVLFIEISVIYIFYSFLEKCSYKNEATVSKAPIITSLVALSVLAIYSIISIIIKRSITEGNLYDSISLLELSTPLEFFAKLYLLLFLTYFEYELRRNHNVKWFSRATSGLIFASLLNFVIDSTISSFTVSCHQILEKPLEILSVVYQAQTFFDLIYEISIAIFLTIMIFALVKASLIKNGHRFISIIFFALIGVDLYIKSQITIDKFVAFEIYNTAVNLLSLFYFLFVVASVRKCEKCTTTSEITTNEA